LTGLTCTPTDGATDWITANWPIPETIAGSKRSRRRGSPILRKRLSRISSEMVRMRSRNMAEKLISVTPSNSPSSTILLHNRIRVRSHGSAGTSRGFGKASSRYSQINVDSMIAFPSCTGMSGAARRAPRLAMFPKLTITLTLRRTRSVASSGSRSTLFSPKRYSTMMFLPSDVAKLAQAFLEPRQFRRMAGRSAWEYPADLRNVRWLLLRARRERPRDRRAAEKRDELAPLHSITSLASASSVGGIVRPSALAVLRLITSSKRVGCSIGKSPGFVPFRILSMNQAARRYCSRRLAP